MNRIKNQRLVRALVFLLFLFGVDQYLKYLAVHNEWDGLLFTLSKNQDSLMGVLDQNWLFINILISVLIICGIVIYLWKKSGKLSTFALYGWALIGIGGISNTIDRVYHSFVIDYLYNGISYFNLADLYIVLGLVLVGWGYWRKARSSEDRKGKVK